MALFRYASKLKKEKHEYLYKWDFTKSLVDEIDGLVAEPSGQNAGGIVRDSNGIHFNNSYQCLYLGEIDLTGYIIEIEVPYFSFRGDNNKNISVVANSTTKENDSDGIQLLYYKPSYGWCSYGYTSETGSDATRRIFSSSSDRTFINGKNIKLEVDSLGFVNMWLDDQFVSTNIGQFLSGNRCNHLYLGGYSKQKSNWFDSNDYDMTISKVAIYKSPHYEKKNSFKWDFTKSLFDEINGVPFQLVTYSGRTPIRNSEGIRFTSSDQMIRLPMPMLMNGKTIEIDVANMNLSNSSNHISFIMNTDFVSSYYNTGSLRWHKTNGWGAYLHGNNSTSRAWTQWDGNLDKNYFNGKTVKIKYEDGNKMTMWVDDELIGVMQSNSSYHSTTKSGYSEDGLFIGGINDSNADGNYFYNVTISGVRIYENEE